MIDKTASFLQLIRRGQRGRLKIYLGYAAGVGKTYQMLQEAQRLKTEGIDVVIGLVETHGREETEKLKTGLEQISMRRIEYRGITVEEMDLDAVVVRRPHVAIVDELAHTNAPGSRNPKRYQDVEDILAAGINVITTLNVQHLESLYDTVEQATSVKVRERLPDSVLAEADQIVNIDIVPEDLQKRLREGKIYPLERVPVALENFFQARHLEQLRELTLRETASQIDFRRRETGGEGNPAAADQIMVCLYAGGRGNAALLRFGSRLAGRLNRNWYAVYVQTLRESPTAIDAERQRLLADTLTLANQLGATVFTLKGEDIADTLWRFAKEYRVGHVIVGKPHPRPWWKRLKQRKDVVRKFLLKSSGLALTVIDTRIEVLPEPYPLEKADPSKAPAPASKETGEKLKLTDFLRDENIVIWDDPVTKIHALRELLKTLRPDKPGFDPEFLLGKLLEREGQGSTFLNDGLALPHARIEKLEAPLVAIGICHGGILDAFTTNPVEIVFLLLSPQDASRSHLQLLAIAGRLMQNRILRNNLRKAQLAREVYNRLSESEEIQK